ncbi:hypothetical protein SCHPADRAFT_947383 [Schizopora paradoxa]|uniref:Uncharacterized protein n=1 Tax=Schizopora paradoxa TaxID=27342 RepID=A0A0H2R0R8_9AGAM|nr:hypothetical protein SCHPADRAFT_947383 [Schizopora paradoxa]
MQSLGFVRFCALIRAIGEFLTRLSRLSFRSRADSVCAVSDTQHTRSHSSAFPEADVAVLSGKRLRIEGCSAVSGERVSDEACLKSKESSNNGFGRQIGGEENEIDVETAPQPFNGASGLSRRDEIAVAGLLDLPYDVLHLISSRTNVLPRKTRTAIMYSCRYWNDTLAKPFLQDAGFSTVLLSRSRFDGISLDVRDDMFLELMHWRRSSYFRHNNAVRFHFSVEGSVRNTQLSCLANLFSSLLPGACHFQIVHMFLSDFECGVNIRLLSDVLYCLHRTGCVDFWIYSSYLCKEGMDDVVRLDLPEFTHAMERVNIQSPCLFSKALFPWLSRTLQAGSSISAVEISNVGMTSEQWSAMLPLISLSRIRVIGLVGVDWDALVHFLSRHPSIETLRLDGVLDNGVEVPLGSLVLPNLETIEGDERRIAHFLPLLDPTIRLRFSTLVFREDCASRFTSRSFDREDFTTALNHFANLQEASTLVINVSCNCGFATYAASSVNLNNRPERLLSLSRLDINIFGSHPQDTLDGCLEWVTLFPSITNFKIWVGSDTLEENEKEHYRQNFSGVLEHTSVRFC